MVTTATGKLQVLPQWSPPVIGGSNGTNVGLWQLDTKGPQWSPPVTGGKTPARISVLVIRPVTAIEPAVEPAGAVLPYYARGRMRYPPQWRPPLGETLAGRLDHYPEGRLPATEPAVAGREHDQVGLNNPPQRAVALEPAGDRRDDACWSPWSSAGWSSRNGARQ